MVRESDIGDGWIHLSNRYVLSCETETPKPRRMQVWVASLFEGDGECDSYVMWRQHDVYESALRIIVATCQEYERFARAMLDVGTGHECVTSVDHRTLQDAHDLLAAAWRFRWELRLRQFELPLEEMTSEEPQFVNHWLEWLGSEVRSWIKRPSLVQPVLDILHNQHSSEGYEAEARLAWEVMGVYYNVPWTTLVAAAVDRQHKCPSPVRLPMLLREMYVTGPDATENPVAEDATTMEARRVAALRGRVFNTVHL